MDFADVAHQVAYFLYGEIDCRLHPIFHRGETAV